MNYSQSSSQKQQRSPTRKRKRQQSPRRQASPKRRRRQSSQQKQQSFGLRNGGSMTERNKHNLNFMMNRANQKTYDTDALSKKLKNIFSLSTLSAYNDQTISKLLGLTLNNANNVKSVNDALNNRDIWRSKYIYFSSIIRILSKNNVGRHGSGKYKFPWVLLVEIAQNGSPKEFKDALIEAGGTTSAKDLLDKINGDTTKEIVQKMKTLHKIEPHQLSLQYLEKQPGLFKAKAVEQLKKQRLGQQAHLYYY